MQIRKQDIYLRNQKERGISHVTEAFENISRSRKRNFGMSGQCAAGTTGMLEAGGTAGHLLSPKQVESWLMTGGGALPREIAFSGTLSELVSLFPKTNAEESKRRLNRILSGVVVEYDTDHWTYFTCQTVVMGCCMGEYLSIVNRKDI